METCGSSNHTHNHLQITVLGNREEWNDTNRNNIQQDTKIQSPDLTPTAFLFAEIGFVPVERSVKKNTSKHASTNKRQDLIQMMTKKAKGKKG